MSTLKVNSIIPVAGVPTGGGGGIIQIKQTFKADTTSTTTSGSFVDVSGMSVSITPTSTSSKILILVSLGSVSSAGGVAVAFKLLRGSTSVGNSDNTSTNLSGFTNFYAGNSSDDPYLMSGTHNFLDSPSTTSATTYKLQWRISSGASYLNRYQSAASNTGSSSITALEVSA